MQTLNLPLVVVLMSLVTGCFPSWNDSTIATDGSVVNGMTVEIEQVKVRIAPKFSNIEGTGPVAKFDSLSQSTSKSYGMDGYVLGLTNQVVSDDVLELSFDLKVHVPEKLPNPTKIELGIVQNLIKDDMKVGLPLMGDFHFVTSPDPSPDNPVLDAYNLSEIRANVTPVTLEISKAGTYQGTVSFKDLPSSRVPTNLIPQGMRFTPQSVEWNSEFVVFPFAKVGGILKPELFTKSGVHWSYDVNRVDLPREFFSGAVDRLATSPSIRVTWADRRKLPLISPRLDGPLALDIAKKRSVVTAKNCGGI